MTTQADLRQRLRNTDWLFEPFSILREIAQYCAYQRDAGRELVIYALEQRDHLADDVQQVLDSLVMQVGLHPYVRDLDKLSLSATFQHACHSAEGRMSDVIFHSSQVRVFERLLDGRSVVLSAPTSYGKSLLVDAYIAATNLTNVVVIVPTIALIEETRRRMARFSDEYKIVTSVDQTLGEQNIFVLTQERYLAMKADLPRPEFFVIDEFYKLDPNADPSRSTLLNQAFLYLYSSGAQFYLLGPSIDSVAESALRELDCDFIYEDFHTVALELHTLSKEPSKPRALMAALGDMKGQTLIYCKSPASTRQLARNLIEIGYTEMPIAEEVAEAATWTAQNFHDQWLVSKALSFGVGIHHGGIPRALARFMVRAFEEGLIRTLLCTSTLIEGVNTSARNVVVYDNKVSTTNLDFFTFNNIKGRSGRMFRHYVGNVFVFDPPPQPKLPLVDMPAFNPTGQTPSSILINKDYASLPEDAKEKIGPIVAQEDVPIEVLRKHSGVEPERFLEAKQWLVGISDESLAFYAWSGMPEYDQLRAVAKLIWEPIGGKAAAQQAGMRSADMMTFWVWRLYRDGDVARFRAQRIADEIDNRGRGPDEAVENVLKFLRNWASFHLPKFMMAADDVVRLELCRREMPTCDYSSFAAKLENLFQPRTFLALEEYGLPLEFSAELARSEVIDRRDSLDAAISKIRTASRLPLRSTAFTRGVIEDFVNGV